VNAPVKPAGGKADLGVGDVEAIEAVFSNRGLYVLADGLVPRDPTKGGRPQRYPDYLVLAVDALADIYTSLRAAATALHDSLIWDHVRQLVRDQFPDDPSKWLPEEPPSRTWYYRRRNAITDQGTALDELRVRFRAGAVNAAREIGLLDPEGPGSPTHPDRSRMIHHDGKAIRQMYDTAPGDTRMITIVDPDTGEVHIEERQKRYDHDAKVHHTGDQRQISGSKFWLALVRGPESFTRVILDIDHVPTVRSEQNSEADIATQNLIELAPLVPGALGAICDTVLRGKHLDALERHNGWIIINPVTAEHVDPKTGERTEKGRYLHTVTFAYPGGSQEDVEIWYIGGRLHRLGYADDGTEISVPLDRVGNPIRKNANGTFRTYVEYTVPDPRGGAPQRIREATYNTVDDTFNRAENIRQIPPGDPDYTHLMGRRSDAEAANRQIDDQLYLRRARSLGARRQLFDLLAHGLVQNSIALHRHRLRAGPASEMAA
jgi:hypothetical protein